MSTFRHTPREIERSAITVRHDVQHLNKSVAHADWAQQQTLHLAVAYSNPLRWNSRQWLFNEFRRHMETLPNIRLYVVELAFGDRPFEVTNKDCPYDIQFRTRSEIWHKENLLNLAIWRFDRDWEYGGWVDGDIAFSKRNVGIETIHQLQHYDWVQMFSQVQDLGPNEEVLNTRPGYCYALERGLDVIGKPINQYGWPGSPGFAWAFRRESFEACGGLLDTCILGSGDHHMAVGLSGGDPTHYDTEYCGEAYKESIETWQARAYRAVKGNIGAVPGLITHSWHGPRPQRGYETRWKILRDFDYNPYKDIHRDDEGVYTLSDQKPGFRDAIRKYFRSRNEDLNATHLD